MIIYAGANQPLHSQLWQRVGNGLDRFSNGLWTNIESNKLFVTGNFIHADTLLCRGICFWDGKVFGKLTPPPACDLCGTGRLIKFDNKLFATGEYTVPSSTDIGQVMQYENESWSLSARFPKNSAAGSIVLVNDKLLILGLFDSISGIRANCIALYNPENNMWERFAQNEPFQNTFFHSEELLNNATYYKNEYYFSGNINRDDDFKEILRYDGKDWKPLQKGIFGGFADARGLIVYKDILYVTGYFFKRDGNAGDYIMAWDGEKWFNPFPQIQYLYDIKNMAIISDQLYISGSFIIPADMDSLAYNIARFDGCNFSAFGIKMKYPEDVEAPFALAGFQGKIYASVRDSLQGKYAGYLISFDENTPNYRTINITECPKEVDTVLTIELYPNPFDEWLTIKSTKCFAGALITMCDMLGRTVYHSRFNMKYENRFDLMQLSGGLYYITVKTNEQVILKTKVIKL